MRGQGPAAWGRWGGAGLKEATEAAPPPPRVLIAAAAAETRRAHRVALSPFPVQMIEAPTGQDAVQALQEGDFAFFVLEGDLPDMSSFELTAQISRHPVVEAAPILLVLSAADPAKERTAYRMGAADCLTAPVNPEVLGLKAQAYLRLHARRAKLLAELEHARSDRNRLEADKLALLEQQGALLAQATRDPLTGLPNPVLLEDRIDTALKRAARNQNRVAVVVVDMDSVQQVSEEHGAKTGDELIAEMARRLLQIVRSSDTVARLGTDRFAIVLEGLQSEEIAEQLSQKMAAAVARPCTLLVGADGRPVDLAPRASLGVAVSPGKSDTHEQLLANAQAAIHKARHGQS